MLALGTRNVIWIFLFHFSFVSSASWLVLRGVMSTRRQAAIALLRIVFLCNGWLWHAILISCIRIIRLHGFFFISWASSHVKDDCYMGCTHRSLQDKLKLIVCSMFTVPNMFGVWHCDALEVTQEIFGNPVFAQHMEYDPYQIFEGGEWEYGEWMSSDEAYHIQVSSLHLLLDWSYMCTGSTTRRRYDRPDYTCIWQSTCHPNDWQHRNAPIIPYHRQH